MKLVIFQIEAATILLILYGAHVTIVSIIKVIILVAFECHTYLLS